MLSFVVWLWWWFGDGDSNSDGGCFGDGGRNDCGRGFFGVLTFQGICSIFTVEQYVWFFILYGFQMYSTERKIPTTYVPIYFFPNKLVP